MNEDAVMYDCQKAIVKTLRKIAKQDPTIVIGEDYDKHIDKFIVTAKLVELDEHIGNVSIGVEGWDYAIEFSDPTGCLVTSMTFKKPSEIVRLYNLIKLSWTCHCIVLREHKLDNRKQKTMLEKKLEKYDAIPFVG